MSPLTIILMIISMTKPQVINISMYKIIFILIPFGFSSKGSSIAKRIEDRMIKIRMMNRNFLEFTILWQKFLNLFLGPNRYKDL